MLPGIDGLEVCLRLRTRDDDARVIHVTALDSETDRVVGLEHGPYERDGSRGLGPGELVLRLDPRSRQLGCRLPLTVREFDLLRFLMSHPGEAFTREELLEHVWGWSFGDRSTVTVHVRRLREKIEADPSRPERLATVWGVGYRWEAAS
jgi:DNA-binding response OmpR family regulator